MRDMSLGAAYLGLRACLPVLAACRGAVVLVSSVHAVAGLPGHPAYASKFLKVSTDEGITGWGEPVVEGRAEAVAAQVEAGVTAVKMNGTGDERDLAIDFAASVQIAFAVPDFLIQEQSLRMHYNTGHDLLDYLVDPTIFHFVDGHAARPEGPGLGIEIDEPADPTE